MMGYSDTVFLARISAEDNEPEVLRITAVKTAEIH
jgi:hypothetical protein